MSTLFNQEAGPQPPREVRSKIEILALLKNLQQRHEQLTVTFTDRTHKFQSFIVKIDADARLLWIDEMIPRQGDRYAAEGESFRLDAWVDGVHLSWHCPSADKVSLEDAPAYRAALPDELIYHQKRGAFRAPVRRSLNVGIGIAHAERSLLLIGNIMDISATGCKARVPGNCTHQLPPGEEFEHSYLTLPDSPRGTVSMEVRHAAYEDAIDETHVGLRFKQPTAPMQRQIDRFVNYLQREARRLEKDDLF